MNRVNLVLKAYILKWNNSAGNFLFWVQSAMQVKHDPFLWPTIFFSSNSNAVKQPVDVFIWSPVFSRVGKKAIVTLAEKGLAAYNQLSNAEKTKWEIHIVAHSAGSIFLAYALEALLKIGIPVKSLQFMAPAISIDLFKQKFLPLIEYNSDLNPTLYVLSDKGERDDDVGPYGKSLLYLVSNAFERTRETPLLGMEKFINSANRELDKKYIDCYTHGA